VVEEFVDLGREVLPRSVLEVALDQQHRQLINCFESRNDLISHSDQLVLAVGVALLISGEWRLRACRLAIALVINLLCVCGY
jgi:hypothetical protein